MSKNNNKRKESKFQHYLSIERLFEKDFGEDKFIVDGILPEGSLVLLSARPKAGKTNLALQMATAIAGGKLFLGKRTERRKVLFISLELNQKQIKKRLAKILNFYGIDNLHFFKFPLVVRFSSENKGIEALSKELRILKEEHKITFDVIFVDTYVLFKDIRQEAVSKHKSVYELESEYLAELRKFCEENSVTMVLIYHNRKAQPFAGDITENIMGSTGIAGAVNEIFILERKTGDKQAKLMLTGHTVEEQTIELRFENGIFEVLTATKKELLIAETIIEYLKQVFEATQSDVFNHLKARGITKDKPLVISILNKFEGEYWKVREKETGKGRAKKLYSLPERKAEETKQYLLEEDIPEDFDELIIEENGEDEAVDF